MANASTSEHCASCGCSVRPTYAQVQSAKEAAGVVEPVDGPTLAELAVAFRAYLAGKPSDTGWAVAGLFELLSYAVVLLVLLFIFHVCRSLGLF
jgi:hypothetical protein